MAVVRIALWSLADTPVSLDDLRRELPRDADETWFSDESTERLGSFAVFPDADAAGAPFPEQLRELIGKDPDLLELFDLE
jgi:hypothetical protein